MSEATRVECNFCDIVEWMVLPDTIPRFGMEWRRWWLYPPDETMCPSCYRRWGEPMQGDSDYA